MKNRILAELDFASILNESKAQTATGADLLRKYQSFLITNESSHNLVNAFVKEASVHTYDNGINAVLVDLFHVYISEKPLSEKQGGWYQTIST